MRSTGSGPLGALLMLAPLIAVPILAVVGIPQFAPGNLLDQSGPSARSSRDRRELEDPGFGDDLRHGDPDDLFKSVDRSQIGKGRFKDPLNTRTDKSHGRRQREDDLDAWEDQEDELSDTNSGMFDENSENLEQDITPEPSGTRRKSRQDPKQYVDAGLDGDSFSDAGSFGDSSGGRRSRPQSRGRGNDLEEVNPFEESEPPPRVSRPKADRASEAGDLSDAPEFVPTTRGRARQGESGQDQEDAPLARTRPRGSKVIPPAAPEPPAEQEQSEIPEDNAAPEQPGAIDHLTWQIATKRLRALGVGKSKQHFTYLEDKNLFLFTCNASHLDDAARTRTFQAEAEEPLLAVRQVLEKLQTWQDSEITPRSPSRTSPRGGL